MTTPNDAAIWLAAKDVAASVEVSRHVSDTPALMRHRIVSELTRRAILAAVPALDVQHQSVGVLSTRLDA